MSKGTIGREHPQHKPSTPTVEGASAPSTGQQPTPTLAPQPGRIEVHDAQAVTCYANFCRVTGTPEELILDFGLHSNPMAAPDRTQNVEVAQRLVLDYFTAKRMLQALQLSVQRHEAAFGVLETDVQKRVVGRGPIRAARPG